MAKVKAVLEDLAVLMVATEEEKAAAHKAAEADKAEDLALVLRVEARLVVVQAQLQSARSR